MRRSARWILSLVALAFVGIVPSADATTIVSYNGTQGLTVTGDAADSNISISPGTGSYLVLVRSEPAFSLGGCTQTPTETGTNFECPVTGARVVTATGAAGKDQLGIQLPPANTITVDLGDGDDGFAATLSESAVTVDGGNGDDILVGSGANDVLRGGPEEDFFFGHGGSDSMLGGDGDDKFLASAKPNINATPPGLEAAPLPDFMDGGPGADEVEYMFTSEHVNVSLDNVANDGRAGENDNAFNIENILGGQTTNTITGNDQANRLAITICCPPPGGDDVIHGGGGPDRIGGGPGDDQIFGDDGNDIIFGGADSDMIDGGPGNDDLRDESQVGVVIDGGPNGGNDPSTSGAVVFVPGNDTIFGGPGEDLISTRGGTDVTHGGGDADTFQQSALEPNQSATVPGPETAFGDDGADHILVFNGTAATPLRLEGGEGNDVLIAAGVGSTIELGGPGDDNIRAPGNSADMIEGSFGNDVIESGPGDDQVDGGSGSDLIGNPSGSDTIFGGPGGDTINTRQGPPPSGTPAFPDTVDCGRNLPLRDNDGDSLTANLIDTAVNCENVVFTPAGERANVFVPKRTLLVPAQGRVEVEVHCLRKHTNREGCKGTIRLGTLAINGNAGPPGPKQHFQIDRGDTETLLLSLRAADRAKLRNKANERARVEIVQPGDKGPHTTIRALEAKRE